MAIDSFTVKKGCCPPLQVAVRQQVIAAFSVVVLQRLAFGEVVGGEGQTGWCGQRLPVHPHCAAEAGHCRGRRQQQGFRSTHTIHTQTHKQKNPHSKDTCMYPEWSGTCVWGRGWIQRGRGSTNGGQIRKERKGEDEDTKMEKKRRG